MTRRSWAVLLLALAACGGGEAVTATRTSPTRPSAQPPKSFPIVTGWAHGKRVDYLLQEISDPGVARLMRQKTGFNLPVVEALAKVPRKALGDLYLFMNGVKGPNPFGFQRNVIDAIPGESGYSPLWLHTFVRWKNPAQARELKSEEQVLSAERDGEVTLEKSKLVINCPVLPGGRKNFPVVTGFVDGKLVDYLLEEISDPMVTRLMSDKTQFPLTTVKSLSKVPEVAHLYLFMNGIRGPNPFGFQRNVIDSVPGEATYSPLWLHTFVRWTNPSKAQELRSEEEIQRATRAGEVKLEGSSLVINCPVIPGTVRAA